MATTKKSAESAQTETPKVDFPTKAQTGQSIDLGRPRGIRHPDGTAMTSGQFFVPTTIGDYVVVEGDDEYTISVTDLSSKA